MAAPRLSQMLWGADPDKETKWEEPEVDRLRARHNRPLRELVFQFQYPLQLRMDQKITESDLTILYAYFNRRLQQGVTPDTLREMVHLFYNSPYANSERPVLMFVKNETQADLTSRVEMSSTKREVQWLLDGMPEVDWMDDSTVLRRTLNRCHESLLRYPELVLRIIRLPFGVTRKIDLLDQLEGVILWNMDEGGVPPKEAHDMIRTISPPKELRSTRRGGLRPPAESLADGLMRLKK